MCDACHRCVQDVRNSEFNIASESLKFHSSEFQIPGARARFYKKKSEQFKAQASLLIVYIESLDRYLMWYNLND